MPGRLIPRSLVLIRHAMPEIDPAMPPASWELSEAGRVSCLTLADQLRRFIFQEIVSSTEPKATGTAQALADILGIRLRIVAGLHEHEREVVPWLGDQAWQAQIQEFFNDPDKLIFGRETASQALARYQRAIESVVQRTTDDVVIVSHGTIMSLYIASQTGESPYQIWRGLKMPDVIVLPIDWRSHGEVSRQHKLEEQP